MVTAQLYTITCLPTYSRISPSSRLTHTRQALSVSTEEKDDAGKMISIQRKLVEVARRVPKEKEEFMNQLMLESVHSCLGITIPNSV